MSLYNSYGIYGITNKINGMIYIGKTEVSFGDRRDCHYASLRNGYGVNKELQPDWNKYGENNFEFIVIYNCSNSEDSDTVNELERKYIKKYMDIGISYNVGNGGLEGTLKGKHFSEATKKKIGSKNKINMTGRKLSKETKAKMSRSHKLKWNSLSDLEKEEYGKATSKYASGYSWNEASKQKFSEKQHESPNGAKYNVKIVHKIRELHEIRNKSYSEISDIMRIPRSSVYLIATYRRWRYA